MQIFLNFINFYRRFIYNYFIIIALLIDLLKNNKNDRDLNFLYNLKTLKKRFYN